MQVPESFVSAVLMWCRRFARARRPCYPRRHAPEPSLTNYPLIAALALDAMLWAGLVLAALRMLVLAQP